MFLCFVYLSGVFNCSDRRLLKIRTCSLKNSSLKKKKILLSLKGLSHRTRYARRWTLGSALPFRYNVICAVLCQEQSRWSFQNCPFYL